MKIGIAMYKDQIASVFDSADRVCVFNLEDANNYTKSTYFLPVGSNIVDKTDVIKKSDIEILICGAISNQNRMFIEEKGINVEAWIFGSIEEIIYNFFNGKISNLKMPGCKSRCRRGRRHRYRGGN